MARTNKTLLERLVLVINGYEKAREKRIQTVKEAIDEAFADVDQIVPGVTVESGALVAWFQMTLADWESSYGADYRAACAKVEANKKDTAAKDEKKRLEGIKNNELSKLRAPMGVVFRKQHADEGFTLGFEQKTEDHADRLIVKPAREEKKPQTVEEWLAHGVGVYGREQVLKAVNAYVQATKK